MLQGLLGHTTLMITNRYCQAVGCSDTVEAHKRYSPIGNIRVQLGCIGTGCWGESHLDNRRVVPLLYYSLFCMLSPRFV